MTADALKDLQDIADPVQRARRATEIIETNTAVNASASAIRQEALELLRESMTHTEIARQTGLTRARVSQLLAGARPERAILAPDPGPMTICVIERKDAEKGGSTITSSTQAAAVELAELASSLGVTVTDSSSHGHGIEVVPIPGLIDLNRPNLVVLIGPRSSPLIAQAVSADPKIRWQPDESGDWFITDSETSTAYHSDFDRNADPGLPWPRTCYAHVGRIRRPDGKGSWLCLAGEHRQGVAGAAEYICRDITPVWEKARRNLWSTVVRVKVSEDGAVADVSLASPLYVHGRV